MAINSAKMLVAKMCQNIAEREAKGINQSETRILLQALADANKSTDNITLKRAEKLYKELLMEANAQLGLLQLPEAIFGKYTNLIKQIQFQEMRDKVFDGKDPRVELKRLQIQSENQ